jgi:hypothetical protein
MHTGSYARHTAHRESQPRLTHGSSSYLCNRTKQASTDLQPHSVVPHCTAAAAVKLAAGKPQVVKLYGGQMDKIIDQIATACSMDCTQHHDTVDVS